MTKPRIAVGSLGGTITMTSAAPGGGISPTLDAGALVAAVPGLADAAVISARTLLRSPGASLTFPQLRNALSWAKSAVADGHDGVVIVQGTDTLEETSYFFDLFWDEDCPLVVTGAMRDPQQLGADGSANLLAAVVVAGSQSSRGLGVLVVMNNDIHAAVRVRKVRASGLAAFESPNFGVLGHFEENRVAYFNRLARQPQLSVPSSPKDGTVALLETNLGDEGKLLHLAAHSGEFAGIVLAGFGVGHVSSYLAEVVAEVVESCPVILSTRTGAGTTFSETYGFTGSERDLIGRGAITSGWLDSRKSCVLLRCLLSAGSDVGEIRQEFMRRGAYPAKPESYVQ